MMSRIQQGNVNYEFKIRMKFAVTQGQFISDWEECVRSGENSGQGLGKHGWNGQG